MGKRGNILTLAWLLAGVVAWAESPSPPAFTEVQDAVWSSQDHPTVEIPYRKLPPPAKEFAQMNSELEGRFPDTVKGYLLDLNGDGREEFFLYNYITSARGPSFLIWSDASGAWKIIGSAGDFSLLKAKPGEWMPIVDVSKQGPDEYWKIRQEMKNGKYEMIEIQQYDLGKIIKIRP